jgi:hypothetical protein
VTITMYGFVGADTRMLSDLAVAADIGGSGGESNHDTYFAHPLQGTGIQLVPNYPTIPPAAVSAPGTSCSASAQSPADAAL